MTGQLQPEPGVRREALGAFSHDLRTPLTALRMLFDLASDTAQGEHGFALRFDGELADMLSKTVADLDALADAIQEYSRLERGLIDLEHGPGSLSAALAAARTHVGTAGRWDVQAASGVSGPWDQERLGRAIAGIAAGVSRLAQADRLTCAIRVSEGTAEVTLSGGEVVAGPALPATADAGFEFFLGLALAAALGGTICFARTSRSCTVGLTLPIYGAAPPPGDSPGKAVR